MKIRVRDIYVELIDDEDRCVLHEKAAGYERASLERWYDMVVPGRVAVDVGAYTGIYSIVAAMRGATAVAIEPMPASFWRMGINVKSNKVSAIMFNAAAADFSGVSRLHYNPKVALTTGASLEPGELHSAAEMVRVVEIDALALNGVAAMKIDVENCEHLVIGGALKTIDRDRPRLLIECLTDEMRERVAGLLPGYRATEVLDKRNTVFEPT